MTGKIGLAKPLWEKVYGPKKYSWEKYLDPRNNHGKKFQIDEIPTKAQWSGGTRPTRPTMAHEPLHLVYSKQSMIFIFLK